MNTPADPIMSERRQLTNLAYRLLGSVADAEDVVQEAFLRWYAMSAGQRAAIASPGAWLTTVAGRICLDVLRSARVRRERYVGEWIPEPVPDHSESANPADPADRITLDESVSMAFLVVLDAMTPAERVAFVLHDVFRYSFNEVAEIVGRTPVACRQLASSARRRLRSVAAPEAPVAQRAAVVREFKEAWERGDIAALVGLLDPRAMAVGDGGGFVGGAAPGPVQGAEPIARFLTGRALALPGIVLMERTVNGQPGLVAQRDGVTVAVVALDVADDRVTRIWAVLNPDKLHAWQTA